MAIIARKYLKTISFIKFYINGFYTSKPPNYLSELQIYRYLYIIAPKSKIDIKVYNYSLV